MFSEQVAKADPLIQHFNLSQRWQYSTRVWEIIESGIWYFKLKYYFFFATTLQWLHGSFFQIWCFIFIQNVAVNLVFSAGYITHKYPCWYLDERIIENFLWKYIHHSNVIFSFWVQSLIDKKNKTNSYHSCRSTFNVAHAD